MARLRHGSRYPGRGQAGEVDLALLWAGVESMINPQVLLEAVRDPVDRVVDFRYRAVNRAACAYLGLERHDLLTRSILETFTNLEESGLLARYGRCVDGGGDVLLDDLPYYNDSLKENRYYDVRATRAGRNLLSLSWTDVTERAALKQRIVDSEQKYRLIAENAVDVVLHARDGRVVWISPSVEALTGAPADYWRGRKLSEVVPPGGEVAFAGRMKKLAAGGVVQQRVQMSATDGTIKWIDLHAKPFWDDAGRQDGFIAALRDVDQEVAAQEQALKALTAQTRADALYRQLMDNAAVGMCLSAPDGRFTEVNAALCEFFGCDEAVLLRQTWMELTTPEYHDADLQSVLQLIEGRIDTYRIRKQFFHADGHRIWGDLSVGCLRSESGEVEHFISQILDITTEMALADSLRRQSDELSDSLSSAASYMSEIMPIGLDGEVVIESRYLPAQELGGDCFDYFWIDDDHLVFYLIDVSGHGIEPALLSVSLHNVLRSRSFGTEAMLSPRVILAELNRHFQMDVQAEHYFTIFYAVYESSTRTLRYSNAGCPPPAVLVFGAGDSAEVAGLQSTSRPVGMFRDTIFGVEAYVVPQGCQMLVYSDGAAQVGFSDDPWSSSSPFHNLLLRIARSPDWSIDDLARELRASTLSDYFEDDCSLIRIVFS